MNLRSSNAVLFLAGLAVALPVFAAPKITAEQTGYDFGRVPVGTVIDHQYLVRNSGDEPLLVHEVKASCGCTSASISTNIIPPGAEAKVRAVLDLKNRSGVQNKVIFVRSNDPAAGTLVLYLSGSVRSDYEYSPSALTPGAIRGDAPVTFTVAFHNYTTNELHITNVVAQTPQLAAEYSRVANTGDWNIAITTRPPLENGTIKSHIRVETDSPFHPSYEIPFEATVGGGVLTVIPPENLPASTSQATVRYISLIPAAGRSFNIVSVETPDPSVKALHIGGGAGPAGTKRVALRISPPVAALNGKVVKVTTDLPEMKEVLVPLVVSP